MTVSQIELGPTGRGTGAAAVAAGICAQVDPGPPYDGRRFPKAFAGSHRRRFAGSLRMLSMSMSACMY
jgi:hypothetical protein